MTTHPACPLTEATAPLYADLWTLAEWRKTAAEPERSAVQAEIYVVTSKLWAAARRDKSQEKERK